MHIAQLPDGMTVRDWFSLSPQRRHGIARRAGFFVNWHEKTLQTAETHGQAFDDLRAPVALIES